MYTSTYGVLKPVSTGLSPSSGLGWKGKKSEVQGPTSVAVTAGVAGTAAVEVMKAPPVPGVQKPPRWVGKQFWDRLKVAPKKKVKIPLGLKTRPA